MRAESFSDFVNALLRCTTLTTQRYKDLISDAGAMALLSQELDRLVGLEVPGDPAAPAAAPAVLHAPAGEK